MSNGTLGRVFYRVRPAKNVERKMICEALGSLHRIAPLSGYQYVGFGSLEFHDFSILHERLGITAMVSIEKRDTDAERARVAFNQPYGHITMEWGTSQDRLPDISWSRRSIVWLDYDDFLDAAKLQDLQFLASQLRSGSCLIVTVLCEPMKIDPEDSDPHATRLAGLEELVGKEKIPENVRGGHLREWGLAEASRRIVSNEIEATLAARNGPLPPSEQLEYFQIFNFNYADGTKMATFGGVVVGGDDRQRLSRGHFKDFSFFCSGSEPYAIHIPKLTVRETRWLNQRFPYSLGTLQKIPRKEVDKYRRIYRYFPEFLEVEAG